MNILANADKSSFTENESIRNLFYAVLVYWRDYDESEYGQEDCRCNEQSIDKCGRGIFEDGKGHCAQSHKSICTVSCIGSTGNTSVSTQADETSIFSKRQISRGCIMWACRMRKNLYTAGY